MSFWAGNRQPDLATLYPCDSCTFTTIGWGFCWLWPSPGFDVGSTFWPSPFPPVDSSDPPASPLTTYVPFSFLSFFSCSRLACASFWVTSLLCFSRASYASWWDLTKCLTVSDHWSWSISSSPGMSLSLPCTEIGNTSFTSLLNSCAHREDLSKVTFSLVIFRQCCTCSFVHWSKLSSVFSGFVSCLFLDIFVGNLSLNVPHNSLRYVFRDWPF